MIRITFPRAKDTIFWVKILKFFDINLDPGWKNSDPGRKKFEFCRNLGFSGNPFLVILRPLIIAVLWIAVTFDADPDPDPNPNVKLAGKSKFLCFWISTTLDLRFFPIVTQSKERVERLI
jgi:hypothetical protein